MGFYVLVKKESEGKVFLSESMEDGGYTRNPAMAARYATRYAAQRAAIKDEEPLLIEDEKAFMARAKRKYYCLLNLSANLYAAYVGCRRDYTALPAEVRLFFTKAEAEARKLSFEEVVTIQNVFDFLR